MKPSVEAIMKEIILEGGRLPELVEAFRHQLKPGTVNTYACRIKKALTIEEQSQMFKSQAARRGLQKKISYKPLSILHLRVGLKISLFICKRHMKFKDFCEAFSFGSQANILNMICGQHDFTLIELIKLSEIIGIPLEDLLLEGHHHPSVN